MNCWECDHCVPIGEGDHICDETLELVLSGYNPTEHFGSCRREGNHDE